MGDVITGYGSTVTCGDKIFRVKSWEAPSPSVLRKDIEEIGECIANAGKVMIRILTKKPIFSRLIDLVRQIAFSRFNDHTAPAIRKIKRTRKLQRRYGPVFREMMRGWQRA